METIKKTTGLALVIVTVLLLSFKTSEAQSVKRAKNVTVASEPGKCFGWPANNGVWSWDGGREILVGYTYGDFVEQQGHNMIGGGHDVAMGLMSHLARSTDGGLNWTSEAPENYVGGGQSSVPSPGGIDFQAPGFAMRVVGTAYHAAFDEEGSFFVSNNRGKNWQGPYRFNGLMEDHNLKGKQNTSRTGYVATGPNSCLIFMSARGENEAYLDKTFVAETTDGGKTFQFVSWVVPLNDPYRAVMPAVSKLKDGTIVVAMRRRNKENGLGWVDVYGSKDNGRTWAFFSRVGETGKHNGNPPALVALKDGRIACTYGDRTREKMFTRISTDGGKSWGQELILRDDFQTDKFGDMDFGYPSLAVNHKNKFVHIYYWATKENPEHHIAATVCKP